MSTASTQQCSHSRYGATRPGQPPRLTERLRTVAPHVHRWQSYPPNQLFEYCASGRCPALRLAEWTQKTLGSDGKPAKSETKKAEVA